MVHLLPSSNRTEFHKILTVGNVKIGLSPTHRYRAYTRTELLPRTASQAWLGMGGQVIGVRGALSSIPGEPSLLMVSVSKEIG